MQHGEEGVGEDDGGHDAAGPALGPRRAYPFDDERVNAELEDHHAPATHRKDLKLEREDGRAQNRKGSESVSTFHTYHGKGSRQERSDRRKREGRGEGGRKEWTERVKQVDARSLNLWSSSEVRVR